MLPTTLPSAGLKTDLAGVRDATDLIAISQSATGWLLQLLAVLVLIVAFIVLLVAGVHSWW